MITINVVHLNSEIKELLDLHLYDYEKLCPRYIELFKKYKMAFLKLDNIYQALGELNEKYPGIIFSDEEFAKKYYEEVYSKFNENLIVPRGVIDKDAVVVVGIAPGFTTTIKFRESKWLFGPSSELLNTKLLQGNLVYYTNICKIPFLYNKYDKALIEKNLGDMIVELSFFKYNKIIFLGQYKVYDRLKEHLSNKTLTIYHPAYLLRNRNDLLIQILRKRIEHFIRGG